MNPLSRQQPPVNPAALEALQAQFALRLCAQLNEDPRPLPASVTERLRFARQQACQFSPRPHQRQVRASRSWRWLRPVSALRSEGSLAWKLASVLPAALLVAGFVGIHWWDQQEQTEAAAAVDVALLSDDVPPNAYADPGFAEFLKTSDTAAPTP